MTYSPILLAIVVLLCITVVTYEVVMNGMDMEPYLIGLMFGAITAFAILILLGGVV